MPTIAGLSNRAAKLLVNGWALSTIVTLSTGHPQQANITGTPNPLDGGLTGGVANNASSNAGRAGWLPRDPYYAPGFHNMDLRLSRQFSFGERVRLALMGEVFNVFNHTNIASVNTTAFSYLAPGATSGGFSCVGHSNACMFPLSTFMAPTATSSLLFGPRQIQISGRLTF
jgi:hypothetical protein